MKEDPEIIKLLREEERLGILTSMSQESVEELETPGEVLEDMVDKSIAIFEDDVERVPDDKEISYESEDMQLIYKLNKAVNQGDSLQEIINLLSVETKRIFLCGGATVYLLSKDKKKSDYAESFSFSEKEKSNYEIDWHGHICIRNSFEREWHLHKNIGGTYTTAYQ